MESIFCILLFGAIAFIAGILVCDHFLDKEIRYFQSLVKEISSENQKLNFEIQDLNHQLDLKEQYKN